MNKPSFFVKVSGLILTLSAIAFFALGSPTFVELFPFTMWIHVAIIALLSYGSWRLHRANKVSPVGATVFFKGFPLWLALLAVPVTIFAAPIFSERTFDLGQTQEGQPVNRKSWFEEGGRYFLRLNKDAPIEIAPLEYQKLQREGFELFARFWVLFSYGSLVLWQYVERREHASGNVG